MAKRTTQDQPDKDSFRRLVRVFDGRCVKCGAKKILEPDHIIPASLGGSRDIKNIQPLCEKCNRSKSNREKIDYRLCFFSRFKMDASFPFYARINFLISSLEDIDFMYLITKEWNLTEEELYIIKIMGGGTWPVTG